MAALDIGKSLTTGYKAYFANPLNSLVAGIFALFLNLFPYAALDRSIYDEGVKLKELIIYAIVYGAFLFLIWPICSIILIPTGLAHVRGESQVSLFQCFSKAGGFASMFKLAVLTLLFTAIQFILAIVFPVALWFLVSCIFYSIIIVDQNEFFASLKISFNIVNGSKCCDCGRWWSLFALVFLNILIAIGLSLVVVVGELGFFNIFTFPFMTYTLIDAYVQLSTNGPSFEF